MEGVGIQERAQEMEGKRVRGKDLSLSSFLARIPLK